MNTRVDNSTFEKNTRYISGMHTDNPVLEPQKYTFKESSPLGTLRSGGFTFDGQVFTRSKKDGGNVQSSWCISGKGLTRAQVKDKGLKQEFESFLRGFFNVIEADVPHTLIISQSDIVKMRETLK